jgi:hypothetical protein
MELTFIEGLGTGNKKKKATVMFLGLVLNPFSQSLQTLAGAHAGAAHVTWDQWKPSPISLSGL